MINIDNFQKYFEPIIEANSNPFQLVYQTTYKENGKLQSKTYEESIELKPIDSDLLEDIIENSKSDIVRLYPKNFFQRLFNNNKKTLLSILENINPDEFIFMNQSTFDKLLHLGIYVNPIIDDISDDTILIASRERLVIRQSDKLEVNYNTDCFRTLRLT
jgi:hypothetical protein